MIKIGLFAAVIALIVGLTPILVPFAHHDQYRYFKYERDARAECRLDPQFQALLLDFGRPVAAAIECLIFKSVSRLEDLRPFRIAAVIVFWSSIWLTSFVAARRLGLTDGSALLLSVFVHVLPGFLNLISMANIAPLLAVIAATLAYDVHFRFSIPALRLAVLFAVMLFAHFCYPAAAYFAVFWLFMETLRSGELFLEPRRIPAALWNRLGSRVAVLFASTLVYFLIVRYLLHPMIVGEMGAYAFKVSTNVIDRIDFTWEFIKRSTHLWLYLDIRIWWVLLVLLFVRLGLSRVLSVGWKTHVLATALVFAFALLGAAPVAASPMGDFIFRIAIPAQAVFAGYLFFLLEKRARAARGTAVFAVALSTLTLAMHVWNCRMEFAFLRDQIAGRIQNYDVLVVVSPNRMKAKRGFNGLRAETDEFNVNSSAYPDWEIAMIFQSVGAEIGENWREFRSCGPTIEACRSQGPGRVGVLKVETPDGIKLGPRELLIDVRPYSMRGNS